MRTRRCLMENILDKTPVIQSDSVLLLLEEQKKQIAEQLELLHKLFNIRDLSEKEVKYIKKAITLLETYYTNTKKSVTVKLEKDISEVVNLWYANDYDFHIETRAARGKVYTTLIDRKRRGRLNIVCGGAVKQTLGVLFNFAFIRSVGSEFIFLDESFSSLGIEEVNRLPEVFEMLDDIQMVCIEHKCELIDSNSAVTIRISREVGESSRYDIQDPNLLLRSSILELDDMSFTEQDRKILMEFGIDPNQVPERQITNRFDPSFTEKYYQSTTLSKSN